MIRRFTESPGHTGHSRGQTEMYSMPDIFAMPLLSAERQGRYTEKRNEKNENITQREMDDRRENARRHEVVQTQP